MMSKIHLVDPLLQKKTACGLVVANEDKYVIEFSLMHEDHPGILCKKCVSKLEKYDRMAKAMREEFSETN